jgi:hypothetical protein
MMNHIMTDDSLLGRLPSDIQEQLNEILVRIVKLAGYDWNSNSGSNPDGVILIPANEVLKAIPRRKPHNKTRELLISNRNFNCRRIPSSYLSLFN